jgi:hypothetical protein
LIDNGCSRILTEGIKPGYYRANLLRRPVPEDSRIPLRLLWREQTEESTREKLQELKSEIETVDPANIPVRLVPEDVPEDMPGVFDVSIDHSNRYILKNSTANLPSTENPVTFLELLKVMEIYEMIRRLKNDSITSGLSQAFLFEQVHQGMHPSL